MNEAHRPAPGKLPDYALETDRAVRRWDEALPLGNGMLGCLLWGDGEPLRFSLDRGDLWDLRRNPETLDPGFTYREMVRLVQEGRHDELARRFDDFYNNPYPTKIPAGALEYRLGRPAERVTNRLGVRDGCAAVTLATADGETEIRCFLHAEERVGHMRIGGADPGRLAVIAPDYPGERDQSYTDDMVVYGNLKQLGYPPAEPLAVPGIRGFRQRAAEGFEYAVLLAERETAGNREAVFTVASSNDGEDWFERAATAVSEAAAAGFDAAYERHAAWWERFWSRSRLALPDPQAEFQWYWNNYLFASTSRKGAPPMPLQGVWTADDGKLPPWKGDYHHDLNTELCYWHYFKANHLEEGESFLDFLWELLPQAREYAGTFFEAPGINLPSTMTIDGWPMGGWPMYSLSITSQIWLCQAFDHYWLHTGDEDFLRGKAYVYFSETAACIEAWLKPGEDGKLRLPVSSSPEIFNNAPESWLTPNSNYDLALLLYLFRRLADMAARLGYEADAVRWRGLLEALPELAVDGRGVLLLDPDKTLTESHRHLAHMMAIYPLKLLDPRESERDREIVAATIADMEKYGRGLWVGYSYAWAAAIYAVQGNGEAAIYHLRQLWDHMVSANGFHLNGDYRNTGMSFFHYRPFTLEGNFAAIAALQDMLLQTDGGVIRLFPAIPESWRQAADGPSFAGFRGEMGVLVSARLADGALQEAELYSERGGRFKLANDFAGERLILACGGRTETAEAEPGATIAVELKAGERCVIRAAEAADKAAGAR